MSGHHKLKTWPEPFTAVWFGDKRFEYRRNDRGFLDGDFLCLQEWDPETKEYTGRSVGAAVTFIAYGPDYGIPEGFCVMSISTENDAK